MFRNNDNILSQFGLFIFLILAFTHEAASQLDSVQRLTYSNFIQIVNDNHPLAFQANLKTKEGEALIRDGKGGFDPYLVGNFNQKNFDDKEYWNQIGGGLKVPTWFGMDIIAGYDRNSGEFLNPENNTNLDDLWSLGLGLNLGKGLFIDQRRADMKESKVLQNSTEVQKRLILNQLEFEATLAYLDWSKAYDKLQIYFSFIANAQERFLGVKERALQGDVAQIDTLKAYIQVQNRELKMKELELEFINKKNRLEVFLWKDGFIPLELEDNTAPEIRVNLEFNPNLNLNAIDQVVTNHPEILLKNNSIEITEIEYRLKKESLKPTVQLKYNALTDTDWYNETQSLSTANNKWEAKFSYPVFTRSERAQVQLKNLELQSKQAQLEQKKADIQYKIENSYNAVLNSMDRLSIQNNIAGDYQNLFNAELELYFIGESSLFLVNTREQELIQAQLKIIELQYETEMIKAEYYFNAMPSN